MSAGRVRAGSAGRSREAPELVSYRLQSQLLPKGRSCDQLHTNCASCQTGCHCEIRGDGVELCRASIENCKMRSGSLLRLSDT